MKKIYQIITSLGLVLVMLGTLMFPFAQIVQAGAITSASNTMSRVRINVLSNHEIRFVTPTGAAASQTITVTFPAAFTMGTFALLNFDLAATTAGAGCAGAFTERTLATTATGTTWGVAQAGQVITFTSATDTIPANACIRIRIGNNAITGGAGADQITNPTTAGSYTITIGGTFGSSGPVTVQIIADDQVVVTADVAQTLSFSISDSTIGFGTLSTTASRYATGDLVGSVPEVEAHNLIAATNAGGGYAITIGGTTLTSGTFTITNIGSTNTFPAVGTEQYGVRATASGGIGTVSAPYAAPGFALILTTNEFAISTGASLATTFSVRYLANISAVTEAGNYTSTLTYIATARF